MKRMAMFGIVAVLSGCAGMMPAPAEERTVVKVIDLPSKTSDQIYSGTRIWMSNSFRSSKNAIDLDDKQGGIIITKGIIPWPCSGLSCIGQEDWVASFTMRIDIKPEKVRVSFQDIGLSVPASTSGLYLPAREGPVTTVKQMNEIRPALEEVAVGLGKAIAAPQKQDW